MRTMNRRAAGTTAILAAATLALAACSTDEDTTDSTDAAETTTTTSMEDGTSTEDTTTETSEATAPANGAPTGPGCQAYADAHPDGPASLEAIADQNIVEALPNIPELATLTSALTGGLNPDVDLVPTLEGGEWTIFAPTEDAFAKVDDATIQALQTDADLLTSVLTFHVVDGRAGLDAIEGTHATVEGNEVTVTMDGEEMMVNDSAITCGGIETGNATVYLIDSVLLPPTE
ncbi:fasciclin domain-containing protein [uncultured Corynebacterium sp.]|uniref:fasciclin domain-containing protein n=1 Tax=uncultured Corynebacterium sp. TaxID=159447 RepID=UPI0025CC2563|nr:fasciclin domain-containing protein [uncultured Corynebacterium sp.]